MGSTNGITRGQLRPHFSGRSPPFLLAALCVGLGILGISYWSLSQQYNDLMEQLKKVEKSLLSKESVESDMSFIQSQLSQREEEYSRAKQQLQKNEQQLISSNTQLKTKTDQINEFNTKIQELNKNIDICNEELNKKTNELGDAVTKLKDIEQQKDIQFKDQNQELSQIRDQNTVLTKELEKLKQELFALKNGSKSDVNIKSENNLNENNVEKPLNENNVENSLNDNNLIKTNDTLKGVEDPLKAEINPMDSKNNIQEPVIAEPVKPNQSLLSNGLAEEDRKEEAMLEANDANNNEIADDMKADPNKDVDDSKL